MDAIGATHVVDTLQSKNGLGTYSPVTKTILGKGWKEFLDDGVDNNLCMFPVKRGTKNVPLTSWGEYKDRKPTDNEIGDWGKRFQDINPAVVLGKVSEVIDIEADGDEGYRFVKEKGLPKTWTFKSPSGPNKLHHLYRYPEGFAGIEKAI